MAIERRWLKIKEAAEYLGIHEKSLYRACRRREVPFSKSRGVGVRIDKRELDAMLERRGIRPEELGTAIQGKGQSHERKQS
jgi:excisionase family DNA binding protein